MKTKDKIMREEIVTIHTLGPRGDGLAENEAGERIYVSRAAEGDKLRVKIEKTKQGLLRGEVLDVIEPGTARDTAPCPHYAECGGCQLQHLKLDGYQNWKAQIALQALAGKDIEAEEILPPIFVPQGTRRRTNWAVLVQKDKVLVGYNAQRSHKIVDVEECLVLTPALNAMKEKIKPFMKRLLRDSRRANVFMQQSGAKIEMVITGELASKRGIMDLAVMEAVSEMAEALGLARIAWRAKDNQQADVLLERQSFTASFDRLNVPLSPAAFMQPSQEGQNALIGAVLAGVERFAKKKKKLRFADLFAGSGCFAGHLAAHGAVDAYEFAREPIEQLRKAGGHMGISAYLRNLFERPLVPKELDVYDVVVFDPPRAGAKEQVEQLAASKVPVVIGVSCNPRSFARDAETLVNGGYRLKTLQVVDQFIYSTHAELVGVFAR